MSGSTPGRRSPLRSPLGALALAVVFAYLLVAALAAVGALGGDPEARVGAKYLAPSAEHLLGTDRQGRDIFLRVLHGAKLAISVGLVSAAVAVVLGGLLGLAAGYLGGWVDAAVVGLYSVLQSVPYLLLLMALTYVAGRGVAGLYLAFAATYWVTPCRLVRGEVLKLRGAEYVTAARALGYSPARIVLWHLLPNTLHVLLVSFTLLFVSAIKAEVILSYLGLGVRGQPSWGVMIDQARAELINGFYWQLGGASVAMFGLVLALNVLGDLVSDALDPRVGS